MKLKFLSSLFLSSILTVGFSQKQVVLDNYYNNEFDAKTGNAFHYLWEDTAQSGFSEFGKLFTTKGAKLTTLKEKPTAQNLKSAKVYIIVDPDNKQETANPHFMDKKAATDIAEWVKKGGVLLMLTNDANHAELDSFNLLPAKFGMQYGKVMLHPEKSEPGKPRNFNSCASTVFPQHPLFKGISKIFLKEIAPIICKSPATPVLAENGQVIIAEAKFGKGYVIAVGDPWLYNEYIGHLLLPADFQNKEVAINLVELLLQKTN
jgi:unsaturated rhamnogalacturonyl hydrolase